MLIEVFIQQIAQLVIIFIHGYASGRVALSGKNLVLRVNIPWQLICA
jgi:hypothetical protein